MCQQYKCPEGQGTHEPAYSTQLAIYYDLKHKLKELNSGATWFQVNFQGLETQLWIMAAQLNIMIVATCFSEFILSNFENQFLRASNLNSLNLATLTWTQQVAFTACQPSIPMAPSSGSPQVDTSCLSSWPQASSTAVPPSISSQQFDNFLSRSQTKLI